MSRQEKTITRVRSQFLRDVIGYTFCVAHWLDVEISCFRKPFPDFVSNEIEPHFLHFRHLEQRVDVNVRLWLFDSCDVGGSFLRPSEKSAPDKPAIQFTVKPLQFSLRLVYANFTIEDEGNEEIGIKSGHPADTFRSISLAPGVGQSRCWGHHMFSGCRHTLAGSYFSIYHLQNADLRS